MTGGTMAVSTTSESTDMTVTVELSDEELADLLEESDTDDPAAAIHAAVVGHTQWLAGRNLAEMSGRFYTQDGDGGVIKEWAASEPEPRTGSPLKEVDDAA